MLEQWTERLNQAMQRGFQSSGGYQQGRLIDLRKTPPQELYLVGDIHARWERIPLLVEHAGLDSKLASGEAVLVFLGDLFHREERHLAGEMDSSLATFQAFAQLKIKFPRTVYSLLGNHEFTQGANTKQGFFQGAMFRQALEGRGLYQLYREWLKQTPMVLIHPRLVAAHAGPAISADTLEQLAALEVADIPPLELPPALRELAFFRHREWSGQPERAYDDHHVSDFLQLCSVPDGRLVTGHTPLDRETTWHWEIGRRLTVIFAAGRELGYMRVTRQGEELVRVGREPVDGSSIVVSAPCWPDVLPPGAAKQVQNGHRFVGLTVLNQGIDLAPGVSYRFSYRSIGLRLEHPHARALEIPHFRHLPPIHQVDSLFGTYLLPDGCLQPPLLLKRHKALVLGGRTVVDNTRFEWADTEMMVFEQFHQGEFELRPLVAGFRLRELST